VPTAENKRGTGGLRSRPFEKSSKTMFHTECHLIAGFVCAQELIKTSLLIESQRPFARHALPSIRRSYACITDPGIFLPLIEFDHSRALGKHGAPLKGKRLAFPLNHNAKGDRLSAIVPRED